MIDNESTLQGEDEALIAIDNLTDLKEKEGARRKEEEGYPHNLMFQRQVCRPETSLKTKEDITLGQNICTQQAEEIRLLV